MDKRRKRILFFETILFIFFGTVLIYFLFFNTGLVIEGKQLPEALTVKNESIHQISFIELYYLNSEGKEVKFAEIELLNPGQFQEIPITGEEAVQGSIRVIARAPYHLELKHEINLKGEQPIELSFSLRIPNTAIKGKTFQAAINLCNKGTTQTTASIEPVLEEEFFSMQEEKQAVIEAGECSETVFELNALKTGQTTVKFNISSGELIKEISQIMEVN